MLRFFRQIRQRLLTDNKFSKYLLYAVGEIMLVVIGILIALQVDSWNEERKNELETIENLREIQANLIEDIEQCQLMAKNYLTIRNYKEKILDFDNPLTYNDIVNSPVRIMGRYVDYLSIDASGFENLSKQGDRIPSAYRPILKELRFLYTRIMRGNELYAERFAKTVENHLNFLAHQNWELLYLKNGHISDSEIDYYINDERFKMYFIKYEKDRFNILRSSQAYRLFAIEILNKIDSLIGGSMSNLPEDLLGLSPINQTSEYIGLYEYSDGSGFEEFFIKDDLLRSNRFDAKGNLLDTKLHRRIEDNAYVYIRHTASFPWEFIKTDNGKLVVEFLNDPNLKLVKRE